MNLILYQKFLKVNVIILGRKEKDNEGIQIINNNEPNYIVFNHKKIKHQYDEFNIIRQSTINDKIIYIFTKRVFNEKIFK